MVVVLALDPRAGRPEGVALGERAAPAGGFERTAGESYQAVLTEATDVVEVVLALVRVGGWTIGIGAGLGSGAPSPAGLRSGSAFLSARRAVDAAAHRPARLAVRGVVSTAAADAQAVLSALAVLVERRSDQAWSAIAHVQAGSTQAQTAVALGISRQAVGQRLAAGLWELECDLRPTAARLLSQAGF